MKTIILGRHAKSDWANPLIKDFERPLNARGLLAAPLMGKRLLENQWIPDLIISSYAKRAATTAQLIAHELGYPVEKIDIRLELYEASLFTYLQVLNGLPDEFSLVASFGHNPTTSMLAEYLTAQHLGEVPTASLICIQFPWNHWSEISGNTGKLLWYDYPKNEPSSMKPRPLQNP